MFKRILQFSVCIGGIFVQVKNSIIKLKYFDVQMLINILVKLRNGTFWTYERDETRAIRKVIFISLNLYFLNCLNINTYSILLLSWLILF